MKLIVATLTTDDNRRNALRDLGQSLVASSRAEEGNLSYRFLQDAEDPNTFIFVEEWRDQAAMDGHMRTDHFQRFRQEAPNLLVARPDVKVHEVTETQSPEG